MGGAASVEQEQAVPDQSPIVSVDQAREIMAIVFSRQVTHQQLRDYLAAAPILEPGLTEQILQVLDGPPPQEDQAAVPVSGDLPTAVRNAFFGQFESVKQAFSNADVNGGGTISHEEFQQCVHRCGLILTDEDVSALGSFIDSDHDGVINYQEFLQFLVNADAPDESSTQLVRELLPECRPNSVV